jgi:EF hand
MRFSAGSALLTAAAAALLAGCASAGGDRGAEHEAAQFLMSADVLLFTDFDADHDRRITIAEIEAGLPDVFARADANHDGVLQPVEFATFSADTMGGMQMPPYRLEFDRNVDNEITSEEFRTELLARAKEYDRNEDGVIVRAEFVRPAPGAGALRRMPAVQPRNGPPPG